MSPPCMPLAHDLDWYVPAAAVEDAGGMIRRRLQALTAGDQLSPAELVYRGSFPAATHTWDAAQLTVSVASQAPRPLLHLVYHSPTGLSWGYAGSGPADLALSILHHALCRAFSAAALAPVASTAAVAAVDGMAITDEHARLAQQIAALHHQPYKFAAIAGLPQHGDWSIEERTVDAWLLEQLVAR